MRNLQVRIRRPPLRPADLELIDAEQPRLTNGSFLARALWLAVDPFRCAPDAATRGLPRPGDVVPARGVGEVIESRHEVFNIGSLVVLDCGLQQLCVSEGHHARLLHPGQTPASTALGVLGAPGMAAYFGLLHLARLRPGETVLVSAAANAAGAMAGQIAMLKGAGALGMAGTREKCDWVTRHARLSACINYAAENLEARLRHLAPHGVDIYFDNVGGELLEKVVASAPPDGYTLALLGVNNAINASLYNKAGFEFLRDIAPVGAVMRVPLVMVVNPSFPASTVPQFIAYAKANPGKITMGSGGVGTSIHVSGELFKMMTGVDMLHVPYRGLAETSPGSHSSIFR